jgi:ribosomal protein L44E
MKIFKKGQILCPNCHTWVSQSVLKRLSKKARDELKFLSDGEPVEKFSRIYECPRCQSPIVRCPKKTEA